MKRLVPFTLTFACTLGVWSLGQAQDKGKDDALDKLLQKLDESKPADAKKPGDVKPEDRDLDSLLKKLGETKETPSPNGRPPRGGADAKQDPDQPLDAKSKPDALRKEDQPLDKHLEELLGRKKKGDQDEKQQQANDENSPLREAIKKMEEVRKKLGESDTGESTRKTEGEIVKELEQILERARRIRAQSQQGKQKKSQQAGNQKQQGDPQNQDNPDGRGVGNQMPKKPNVGQLLAGQKDTWGDLPPNIREELENVFKEEMLPAKRDMIIRYYNSVLKRGRPASGSPRR